MAANDIRDTIAALSGNADRAPPSNVANVAAALQAGGGRARQNMRDIYLIRHGSTELNKEDGGPDRIRGWKDVPLSNTGRKEVKKLADELEDSGIDVLAHSGLQRTADTADAVAKTTGAEVVSWPALRPWNLGDFTGKESNEVHPELEGYAKKKPDEPVPNGESFNQFRNRVFDGLSQFLGETDGKLPGIVTHHRVERLLRAWIAAGQPADRSVDFNTMFQFGEAPATADKIKIDVNRLQPAAASAS